MVRSRFEHEVAGLQSDRINASGVVRLAADADVGAMPADPVERERRFSRARRAVPGAYQVIDADDDPRQRFFADDRRCLDARLDLVRTYELAAEQSAARVKARGAQPAGGRGDHCSERSAIAVPQSKRRGEVVTCACGRKARYLSPSHLHVTHCEHCVAEAHREQFEDRRWYAVWHQARYPSTAGWGRLGTRPKAHV